MTTTRLIQIAIALCLMASLAAGSVSACECSHHGPRAPSREPSCHSDHKSPEMAGSSAADMAELGDAASQGCVCFVNLPQPTAFPKSAQELRPADTALTSDGVILADEFVATATRSPQPEFESDVFFSVLRRSLLSARAPPRL